MTSLCRRRYPCSSCPMRADNTGNPDSKFPAARWAVLASTVVDEVTLFGPTIDDPIFACHNGTPGAPDVDLACAGWLVLFGRDHPRVRLALATGRLSPDALTAGPSWPPLHPSWAEVVRHQTGG